MIIKIIMQKLGYVPRFFHEETFLIRCEKDFKKIYFKCQKVGLITNTKKNNNIHKIERMYFTYLSTKYIIQNKIKGDFVECGVAQGLHPFVIAETLKLLGVRNRKIILYDTFDGMTRPSVYDGGIVNQKYLDTLDWCYYPLENVTKLMYKTKYPLPKIFYVVGDVVNTLKTTVPKKIAFLRLDTDFYESTKMELEVLYPLLSPHGVLTVDDYYSKMIGCRKAVDEYFNKKQFLIRLDLDSIIHIKGDKNEKYI